MKETWQNVKGFLKLMKEDFPYAEYIIILYALASATLPFVNLLLYSRILDYLIVGSYQNAVYSATWMIGLSFLLGIIIRTTERKLSGYNYSLDDSLQKQVTYKAFIIEYEEYEKTDSMDSIRMAMNKANGAGGASSLVEYLKLFLSSTISVIYSLYFLGKLMVSGISSYDTITKVSLAALLIILITLLYSGNRINRKSSEAFRDMQKENVHNNSVSTYVIGTQSKTTKDQRLFQMESLFLKYYKENIRMLSVYMNWGKLNGVLNGMLSVMMNLFAASSYIYVGYQAICGTISIGSVLLYAGTIQRFVSYIIDMVANYNSIKFHADFLNEYSKFINRENVHYTGTLPIEKRSDNKYEFEFKNVSFKYPNTDLYVLKNINLKLNVGDKLAVVGRNGAGKTTLIKLLCRLYEPTEGEILLNGINVEKYDYNEYTTIFSPVFQDFAMFSIPLDENVACSDEIDEEKLSECLQKVGIAGRVNAMKDKEHTLLYHTNGEGVEISGGEAQKLAIARALYKDAPFVILDEPTAALDPLAEAEVYENFNDLIHNKSAIYISHRMSSCKFCDDIVVFKDGEIVERGNHQALMEHDGEYASLYNAQAEYYTN